MRPRVVWTAEQEDLMRRLWGRVPDRVLAARLGRSPAALRSKAWDLGIKGRRRLGEKVNHTHEMGCRLVPPCKRAGVHRAWTAEDIMRLELRYGTEPVEVTARVLRRSVNAVRMAASRYGVAWAEAEVA